MQWEKGDQFVFLDRNERGGPEYGIKGDVGEVVESEDTFAGLKPAVIFRFISIVEGPEYEERSNSLERGLEYYVSTSQIAPLTKDYKVDQEPLEDEETL